MEIPRTDRLIDSDRIAAKLVEMTTGMRGKQRVRKIYNEAIDDAVQALKVYADKNPAYANVLQAAARELERNWPLITDDRPKLLKWIRRGDGSWLGRDNKEIWRYSVNAKGTVVELSKVLDNGYDFISGHPSIKAAKQAAEDHYGRSDLRTDAT